MHHATLHIYHGVYIYIQTYITNKQIPIDPVDFLYFITTIHLHYVCIYIYVYTYHKVRRAPPGASIAALPVFCLRLS